MSPSLLERVLAPGGLSVRFQPVVHVEGRAQRTCYVEGLVRGPRGTNVERAELLFSYVRRKRETARMDRVCVATILDAAQEVPESVAIGVNVDASTLAFDATFPETLAAAAAQARRPLSSLVVEIVEHTPPFDLVTFGKALCTLREWGVRIALDDVGLGHSNYWMMLQTRPDFLKVDRSIVKGVHEDPRRADVLRSIVALGPTFGAQVVAEGVELDEELNAVRELGISLVQGYRLLAPVSREHVAKTWRPSWIQPSGSAAPAGTEPAGPPSPGSTAVPTN